MFAGALDERRGRLAGLAEDLQVEDLTGAPGDADRRREGSKDEYCCRYRKYVAKRIRECAQWCYKA